MGCWSEQDVDLVWESFDVAVTPDEAEVLFKNGLTTNVARREDGTYSIAYSWRENDNRKKLRNQFTKHFFGERSIEITSDGVIMTNLSEDEVFSRENIDLFREYDIQLHFLDKEYDKTLLLYGLMKRAFLWNPSNTLYRGMFEKNGNIQIPNDDKTLSEFNEFGKLHLNCGTVSYYKKFREYVYVIKVPYKEAVRELMLNTVKVINFLYGSSLKAEFDGYIECICVRFDAEERFAGQVECELRSLDYAITILNMEPKFNRHQLHQSIISLLESDYTGKYARAYESRLKLLKDVFPEKGDSL